MGRPATLGCGTAWKRTWTSSPPSPPGDVIGALRPFRRPRTLRSSASVSASSGIIRKRRRFSATSTWRSGGAGTGTDPVPRGRGRLPGDDGQDACPRSAALPAPAARRTECTWTDPGPPSGSPGPFWERWRRRGGARFKPALDLPWRRTSSDTGAGLFRFSRAPASLAAALIKPLRTVKARVETASMLRLKERLRVLVRAGSVLMTCRRAKRPPALRAGRAGRRGARWRLSWVGVPGLCRGLAEARATAAHLAYAATPIAPRPEARGASCFAGRRRPSAPPRPPPGARPAHGWRRRSPPASSRHPRLIPAFIDLAAEARAFWRCGPTSPGPRRAPEMRKPSTIRRRARCASCQCPGWRWPPLRPGASPGRGMAFRAPAAAPGGRVRPPPWPHLAEPTRCG